MIDLKKFAQAAMLALLTASFVIPTGAEAANSQQTSNTVVPSTTTQVANFSNLGKSNKTSSSGYFNVNTEGYVTVNVSQTHNSDTAYVLYAIVKDRPDGTTTSYGSANLDGNGSFSFTSSKPLPVGEYYIRYNSKRTGRTSGTISVTTP
ncbi:hypothetical protein AB432_010260 [Brevibacillus brevis]|uniref:Uncharacterized protein n=1 Tax=Brevibacillus brevis TaxID=1393 RepID=A0A2Z4MFT7_BREBE|nr:hypothetical protein [Brevibacillus brevis]AWX55397.1 hypothetical protein AB432_010260 [Brevibacillus brevis]